MMHMIVNYRNNDCVSMSTRNTVSAINIGIQCDLLAVPPLTLFSKGQEKGDLQEISETEEADLTDIDTSFHISQEDSATE